MQTISLGEVNSKAIGWRLCMALLHVDIQIWGENSAKYKNRMGA